MSKARSAGCSWGRIASLSWLSLSALESQGVRLDDELEALDENAGDASVLRAAEAAARHVLPPSATEEQIEAVARDAAWEFKRASHTRALRYMMKGPTLKKSGPADAAVSSTSHTYDCSAAVATWKRDWSNKKKQWCCLHKKVGCEDQPSDSTTSGRSGDPAYAGASYEKRVDRTCGGTASGSACLFPFTLGGVDYTDCTRTGSADGRSWCFTGDEQLANGQKPWGYCECTAGAEKIAAATAENIAAAASRNSSRVVSSDAGNATATSDRVNDEKRAKAEAKKAKLEEDQILDELELRLHEKELKLKQLMEQQGKTPQKDPNHSKGDGKEVTKSVPGMPDVKMPDAPSMPDVRNLKMPGMPNVTLPNMPGMPNVTMPKAPGMPDVKMPNLPGVQDVKMPNLPKLSDIKMPNMPGIPDVKIPNVPGIPEVKMPNLPSMPDVKMPSLPKMPDVKLPFMNRVAQHRGRTEEEDHSGSTKAAAHEVAGKSKLAKEVEKATKDVSGNSAAEVEFRKLATDTLKEMSKP